MIVSFVRKIRIQTYSLPSKVDGSYWITDDYNKKIAVNIEAINGNWVLKKNGMTLLTADTTPEEIILKEYQFYFLKTEFEEEPLVLYCMPDYDDTYKKYALKPNVEINIGSDGSNQIVLNNGLLSKHHGKLTYTNGVWSVEDLNSKYGTYVNNVMIARKRLYPGDIVFMMGLKIIIVGNFILVNSPNNAVTCDRNLLIQITHRPLVLDDSDLIDTDNEIKLYKEDDYFLRSPRLNAVVEKTTISIDPPPEADKKDETPMALTIGPMLTMGMTSMVTGGVTVNEILNNRSTIGAALPSLLISFSMLVAMILWPMLSRAYERKQKVRREKIRQKKYSAYIETKKNEIISTIDSQKHILLTNNFTLDECHNVIINRKETLWCRKINEKDFLNIRIGIGTLEAQLEISYPEKHFTIEEDNLRKELDDLVSQSRDIHDAPICIPLTEKYVTAIVGKKILTYQLLDAIILQLIAAHSYENLKIIFFTNERSVPRWEYLKILPHCWTDDNNMRFFATNIGEMQQLSNQLEEVFNSRKYKNTSSELEESDRTYESYPSYYLLITDDLKEARKTKIFQDIAGQKINYGFSLLIINDKLSNLPQECSMFAEINESQSAVFENNLSSKNQRIFTPDFNTSINMLECTTKLANIPIELTSNKGMLPNVISFLEMYNVGKIEQLNILERWKQNNPVVSLQAPVGLDEAGELFNLDIHEKFHGPHGLIAGMTGSGKSEFIITYILSLAVNYHPDELCFVLIDYKGGGLAGAFHNKESGIKLPHLAGSITNLDTVEMKRSLASIQSELKKRQRIFNKAREQLNESTIDIYKYQRLYREGQVKEPVPHLLIISDEFAELKAQQPEFMDQLISTARIGRSLGVHLILATQKPSGVVDDQIWSNSKFRVCLKVQDKSDSMDMIKCSDAATLKNIGRFYLQVGYNEFFALGQSAWCGMKYVTMDKRKKKIDTAIDFIDSTGYVVKRIENKKKDDGSTSKGEELTNIVNYLNELAKRENINIDQLWLDRIPNVIFIGDLQEKYAYEEEPFTINPIIGEYDDPSNQKQGLLTLNITDGGNAVIYGSAGNGKEELLTSIIYSIIINHSVEEVNLYILDFGAETLKNFTNAPQVGDILLVNDTEKISNLFKMLVKTIETRKKLFADFNGDYKFYCQKSGKKLPNIVVILNYYEAFAEIYNEYEDLFVQITREGLKYGVVFILSVGGTNSIRYRLAQNFKQQLVLQLNDENDYLTILGNTNGTCPSKNKGRGLVKIDEVYEFQTAYPYEKDQLAEYIKILCKKLKDQATIFALKIPILPEVVNYDFIKPYLKDINELPVGVEKESLAIANYDFASKYISLVSAQELVSNEKFMESLIFEFNAINSNAITIDAEELLDKKKFKADTFFNTDFSQVFKTIKSTIEEQYTLYEQNGFNKASLSQYKHVTYIIIGLEKLKSTLDLDATNDFSGTLTKGKDLGTISFIFIDTTNKFKQYEYDEWYKALIINNSGIWIGNGVSEQYTLKLSKTPKEIYEEIAIDFGYIIKNGVPTLIKLININNITNQDDGQAL